MKIIVSHPTGNANVRAVVKGFAEAGLLYRFYTTIASFPGSALYKLGIGQRCFDNDLKAYIKTQPWKEIGRLLSAKTGLKNLTAHEQGIFCIDAVYRHLDNHVAGKLDKTATNATTLVYAYEDGALTTFKKAKEAGLHTIYDLPIAYWETRKQLLDEEAERLPQWAKTLDGGIRDSQQKLERKTKELELADTIICPSDFVLHSLPAWTKNKNKITAKFGSPAETVSDEWIKGKNNNNRNRPLKILFAGSLTQRKGLADLFAAIKLLNSRQVELIVMGSLIETMGFYKTQLENFRYEPVRPHKEVLQLMRNCDVLCLPSIAEGRALVMQEAMSQGLPVIITPNTGGSDLIQEDRTGFLVPIRSPYIIAEKIEWLLTHRDALAGMSIAAKDHAANYSWEKYSNSIIKAIKNYSYNKTFETTGGLLTPITDF